MTGIISCAILALSTLPIVVKIQKVLNLVLDWHFDFLRSQYIDSFVGVFDQIF